MWICVGLLAGSLGFGSEYWFLLFDRACPLTRNPFLINLTLPNPPSHLKPIAHLSSIPEIKKRLSEDVDDLFVFTLLLSLHLTYSPSLLFINEYTTLDTKDLTSNELGNQFTHFWLPIPRLFFPSISDEAKEREVHRHIVSFVRLPSGPLCPGTQYHWEMARDQTGTPVPGP